MSATLRGPARTSLLAHARGGLAPLAVLALAAGLFAAIGLALAGSPPPLGLTLAGGIGLLGVLALAFARYDAVVVLGTALLGAVWIEPAPPDVVFAVAMAVALASGRFTLTRTPLSIFLIVGVFLALNLLSGIFAVDPARAVDFFLITFYLAVLSFWLSGYLDSTARVRLFVKALLTAAVASAALGSFAALTGAPGRMETGGRARALFDDPNVFAPFLVLAALIVLEEILEPRLLRLARPLKVVLFLVLAAGILLAYSRAAWLNAAIGFFTMLAVFALRRRGGRKALVLLVALLATLTAMAALLSATGSVGFFQERARLQQYDTERFSGQETGIQLVVEYPFGIGPGQFERLVDIASHSTYVRALAEQGVLGLATILAFMLTTLVFASRNAVRGRDTYGIGSAALLGAWCGLVANSAFVDTLHWRHFWIAAALVWIGTMRPVPRRRLG